MGRKKADIQPSTASKMLRLSQSGIEIPVIAERFGFKRNTIYTLLKRMTHENNTTNSQNQGEPAQVKAKV
jgi:transposase